MSRAESPAIPAAAPAAASAAPAAPPRGAPARKWVDNGRGLVASFGTQPIGGPATLAAFDFDGTLRHYRGRGPSAEVTARALAALLRGGALRIVVVSNRASAAPKALAPLREYVALVDALAGAPALDVYAPYGPEYRKPERAVWDLAAARHGAGAASFYCGDAAGRPGDFAASDYAFAAAAGAAFYVPEALFGGAPAAAPAPWAPPDAWGCSLAPPLPEGGGDGAAARAAAIADLVREMGRTCPVCVVLMGSPGAGKTLFARRLVEAARAARVPGAERIAVHGNDAEGAAACVRGAARDLAALSHVVIDNTHPTAAARAAAASAAWGRKALVALVHLATDKKQCLALNARRRLGGRAVPDVAIHAYWARRERPTRSEADVLYELPFAPEPVDPAA